VKKKMSEKKITSWNDLSPLTRDSLMKFAKADPSQFYPPLPAADPGGLDMLENGKVSELTALCSQRDTAVNSLRATLDASRRANSFADTSPLYRAVIQRYQEFLNQLAALGASAQDLQAKGRPGLAQMLEAQKADVEGAIKKVQDILGDNAATWNGMNQIAIDTNKKLLTSQLQINEGWKKTFGGGS